MKTAKKRLIRPLITEIAELADLQLPPDTVISVNFPGPRTMCRLNKKYLGHDYLTDVICFNYSETQESLEEGDVAVEIFISPDIARQRARENSNLDYASEMVLYLVHAILHAAGMSDKHPSEKQAMRRRENAILKQVSKKFDFAAIFPAD